MQEKEQFRDCKTSRKSISTPAAEVRTAALTSKRASSTFSFPVGTAWANSRRRLAVPLAQLRSHRPFFHHFAPFGTAQRLDLFTEYYKSASNPSCP